MGLFDFLKRKRKNRAENTASSEVISESLPPRAVEESSVVYNEVPQQSDPVVERGHVQLTCLEIDEMILNELNKSYIAFDVETTGLSSYLIVLSNLALFVLLTELQKRHLLL